MFVTVNSATAIVYDTILGALGICLTLTAAHEFGHKNVRNRASGTLDEDATVTYDEMIEHAFYQGLNLFQVRGALPSVYQSFISVLMLLQAVFIAFTSLSSTSLLSRAVCACACTAPWLFRSAFPVHSFSKNYSDSSRCPTPPPPPPTKPYITQIGWVVSKKS